MALASGRGCTSPETKSPVPFGRPMRQLFLFDDNYVNLNHGSFGAYPSPVREALHRYQLQAEARPDQFIRYDLPRLLDQSRMLIAEYLHAPVEEVVFVPNATTAFNTVLRNLSYIAGDHIVYASTIYGACEKTIQYICETTPATSVKVDYDYTLSGDDLVNRYRHTIRGVRTTGGRVKLAIFEVVASLPGARLPFEKLTEMCAQEGVLSVIDGAHAPGQVPIHLGELQPDFWFGNCHKWLFAPRACAVLYVPVRHQALMRSSLPTSHGFIPRGGSAINNPLPPSNKSEFVSQFEFTGANDASPYLCIRQCLEFINIVCGGEGRVRHYCETLARSGGALVAKMLGTRVMDNEDETLQNCFFSNVQLPLVVGDGSGLIRATDIGAVSNFLSQRFVDDYGTFMATVFTAGSWWVRLSASIYLEMDDFEWGGRVLQDICRRIRDGEYQQHI